MSISPHFKFYFEGGDTGNYGTDGYSYGYVAARTTTDNPYNYSFNGYVCDNGDALGNEIGIPALTSICLSMGFSSTDAGYLLSMSGNDKIPIVLEQLACDGTVEDPSLDCSFRMPLGSSDCDHSELIWLTCTGDGQTSQQVASDPALTDGTNPLQFMLTNGEDGYLYTPNGWVCGSSFSSNEAKVVCFEMGLGSSAFASNEILQISSNTGEFAFGYGDMGLGDLQCSNNPTGISSCDYSYDSDCTFTAGIYLDCTGTYVDLSSRSSSSNDLFFILGIIFVSLVFFMSCCCGYIIVKRRVEKKLQQEEKARWTALKKDRVNKRKNNVTELAKAAKVPTEISEYLTINPTEAPISRTLGEAEGQRERPSYGHADSFGKISRMQLALEETEEKGFTQVQNMTTFDSVDLYEPPDLVTESIPESSLNFGSVPGASTNINTISEFTSEGYAKGNRVTGREDRRSTIPAGPINTQDPQSTNSKGESQTSHGRSPIHGEATENLPQIVKKRRD